MKDTLEAVGFVGKMFATLACMSLAAMLICFGSFQSYVYKYENYQQHYSNGDYIIETYDDPVVKAAYDAGHRIWDADITYKSKNNFAVENTDFMELRFIADSENLYAEVYMDDGISKEDLKLRWFLSGREEINNINIRYYKSYSREIRMHTVTARFVYNGRKYYVHLQRKDRSELMPYLEELINNI